MRQINFFLGLFLIWFTLVASAWAEPQIFSRDGDLVIETPDAKKVKTGAGSEDTLYELLGQEVQIYIFNNKTRIWPRNNGHPISNVWKRPPGPRDPSIEALICKYSQKYGVDPSLVRAVMRYESGFNTGAVSPKGAQGLMQLMPGTAALMGVRNPFDPEQNIAGGVGYLRHCLDRFQHNVPLAVAAYNAGPESVAKCGTIPPFEETQVFVTNVMGSYAGHSVGGNAASDNNEKKTKRVKKVTAREDLQSKWTPELPKRPRPKIIEVRSFR